MKPFRSFLAVSTLCAASGIAGIVGYNYVQNVEFAHAEQRVETGRQQLIDGENLSDAFREIAKVVSPSVVRIDVEKKVEGFQSENPFENDPFFRRFFGPDFHGFGFGNGNGNGGSFEEVGTGSGVIVEKDGDNVYIVTNNHVAGGAEKMTVTLADGRKFKDAKVVGTDPKTDLAVVEIEAKHVIAAKWGNSDKLEQGDWVLAFGAPFGYVGSMTHGIVSALHRTDIGIINHGYENFIQVDAPINPGNSGGPLVNLHGEIVGINTAIASRSGGFQGIGFAIPSNMVRDIYDQIRTKGKVTRGWLGIGIGDVSANEKMAHYWGYDKNTGVLVEQILPNTPAAGVLHDHDIILGLNGKTIKNADELRDEIAATAPGKEVELKVFRNGKTEDVSIKIGEQPANLAMSALSQEGKSSTPSSAKIGDLGLQLGNLTSEQAQRLGLQNVQGAVVLNVEPNSPAANVGLTPGDVITRVGNTNVDNAQEADAALSKADLNKGVPLYVTMRDGSQQFVFIQLGNGQ